MLVHQWDLPSGWDGFFVQPPTENGLKLVEKPQNKRIMKTWQAKIQYKCKGFKWF